MRNNFRTNLRIHYLSGILVFLFTSVSVHADDIKLPSWVIKDYDTKLAVTWYKAPPKDIEFTNTFSLAVGQRTGSPPWLVLRIAYTYPWERDILLIYKYTVTIDGVPHTVRTGFDTVKRSMNYLQKNFSEWYDNYIYDELMTVVESLCNAQYATIGFHGINGFAERAINKAEIERIKSMLDIYKSLSGT